MLQDRIQFTLFFFDLQDYPVTLLELHRFLLQEQEKLKSIVDDLGEITATQEIQTEKISLGTILSAVQSMSGISSREGFYCLSGREKIIQARLRNYAYGIEREKIIRRHVRILKHIPFVRGAALGGSQALGVQKQTSDIDLLIFTHPEFLWLTRTLVTAYLQLIGKRRHGKHISNRFCLNHYLANPREVGEFKNVYTALEYGRLRPLVYISTVLRFTYHNKGWMGQVFPEMEFEKPVANKQHALQQVLESLLHNRVGRYMERTLKAVQLPHIRTKEKFIVVHDDELSFHPDSKQEGLLEKFVM